MNGRESSVVLSVDVGSGAEEQAHQFRIPMLCGDVKIGFYRDVN